MKYLKFIYLTALFIIGIFFSNSFAQFIVPDFQVNKIPGSYPYIYRGPKIAVMSNGNFLIVWIDVRNNNFDVFGQWYNSNGKKINNNFKINQFKGSIPIINQSPNRKYVIVSWNEYAQLFYEDGSKIGDNIFLGKEMDMLHTIAINDNKEILFAWSSYHGSDVFAQWLYSDGNPIIKPITINDDKSICSRYRPKVQIFNDNSFIIVWEDERHGFLEFKIYAKIYFLYNLEFDKEFRVDTIVSYANCSNPCITIDDNGFFVIAWIDWREERYNVYAQKYTIEGQPIGSNFRVGNDSTNIILSNNAFSHTSIACDEHSNYVIAWHDYKNEINADLHAKLFSINNDELYNLKISQFNKRDQWDPDIKIFNNNLYCVWYDNRCNDTAFDVWASVIELPHLSKIVNNSQSNEKYYNLLEQNYPNPFNSQTMINYKVIEPGQISLHIFNINGKLIKNLVDKQHIIGKYSILWDATDNENNQIASGVYFIKLKTMQHFEIKKIFFLK